MPPGSPEKLSPENQPNQELDLSPEEVEAKKEEIKSKQDKAAEAGNYEEVAKLQEEIKQLDNQLEELNEQEPNNENESELDTEQAGESIGSAEDQQPYDDLDVPDAPKQQFETKEERRQKINKVREELGMKVDESDKPPKPEAPEKPESEVESERTKELQQQLKQLEKQYAAAETTDEVREVKNQVNEVLNQASELPASDQVKLAEASGNTQIAEEIKANPDKTIQEIREDQRQAQEQMIDERAKTQEKLDDRRQWLNEAMDSGDYKQAKQELENVYSVVRRSDQIDDVPTDIISAGRNLANELMDEHEFEDAFAVADKLDDESLKRKIENTETAATMKEAGADLANQEIAKITNAEQLDELDDPDDIIAVVDGLQDISDSYTQAEDMDRHKQNAFFKVLNEKRSEAREAAQDWLESAFAELDQQSQEIVDSMEQAAENLPEAPDQPVSLSEAAAYQNNLQEAMNGGRNDVGVREAGLAAQVDNFRNHKGMRGDFLDKRDQIKRVQDGLRNADSDMRVPELQSKYRQAESKLDRTFNDVLYPAYEKANEQLSQADELIKQAFQEEMADLRGDVDDLEESIQLEGPSLSELQSDLMQARQERKESWFGSDSKSDTEKEIEAKISQREEALSEAREKIDRLQSQARELRSQAPEEFTDRVRDLENSLTHKRNHLES